MQYVCDVAWSLVSIRIQTSEMKNCVKVLWGRVKVYVKIWGLIVIFEGNNLENTSVIVKRIKRNKVSHITPLLYGYEKVCSGYTQVSCKRKKTPTRQTDTNGQTKTLYKIWQVNKTFITYSWTTGERTHKTDPSVFFIFPTAHFFNSIFSQPALAHLVLPRHTSRQKCKTKRANFSNAFINFAPWNIYPSY